MQKAPVLKASGLAPIEDEPVHVFGRNLEERVVEPTRNEDNTEETVQETPKEDDVENIKKRKFDAITGEEDEVTVFQGDFKLFSWDTATSNWTERGRGQLKLNDSTDLEEKRCRLIMRTGGTYRILLNVAVKHPIFKVISKTKTNIRFTDSKDLWAASGSNAEQLASLIDDRLRDSAEKAEVADATKDIKNVKIEKSGEDTKDTDEAAQSSKGAKSGEASENSESGEDSEPGETSDSSEAEDEANDASAASNASEGGDTDEEHQETGEPVKTSQESKTSDESTASKSQDKPEVEEETGKDEGTEEEPSDETGESKKLKLSSD